VDEAASTAQRAHPDHDAVAREVSGWFTASAPEIGYQVSQDWYGYRSDLSPAETRVILRIGRPEQVPAALAAVRVASGPRALTIWVDDRARAARLDAAIRSAGARPRTATTHLALVGPVQAQPGPPGLVLQSAGGTRLEEWATVKLQCFGDTEAAPAPGRLAREVALRRAELALAEYQFGLLGGERVAVLAYYRGAAQMVFNLGTRVPYRHRGIGQRMLARWAAAGTASGCRSLVINADDSGRPARLYRGLGFTDEVYWYQGYRLDGVGAARKAELCWGNAGSGARRKLNPPATTGST
jgi:hypothetical protein